MNGKGYLLHVISLFFPLVQGISPSYFVNLNVTKLKRNTALNVIFKGMFGKLLAHEKR